MCRFTLYMGPPIRLASLLSDPEHSLIHQSIHSRERDEPLNGDGFGVAWYAPEVTDEPAVFRSISPAWSNRNLLELCRVIKSPCILAHVRAATQALAVSEANCHPFRAGRYVFMHNGDLGGFTHVRRKLRASLSDDSYQVVGGTTDSEHMFAVWLDRLREVQAEKPDLDPAGRMAEALQRTIRFVLGLARKLGREELSYLNLSVSDGKRAVVARCTTDIPEHADSLYFNRGRRYVCEGGTCRMLDPEEGQGAVLASSERLTGEPGWEPLPVNHMLVIREGAKVEVKPVEM